MASGYVEQIRAVQPDGPYQLLGWSFGGVVAQEMAVQLQQAGQAVSAVILMDAYPASQVAELVADAGPAAGEGEAAADDLEEVLAHFSEEEIAAGRKVRDHNGAISAAHVPGVYDGDVLLIVATAGKAADAVPARAWAPYVTGHVEEIPVPCGHFDMAQPGMLARTGEAVAAWLAGRCDAPAPARAAFLAGGNTAALSPQEDGRLGPGPCGAVDGAWDA
jgi:thioesterase domain-containing protein